MGEDWDSDLADNQMNTKEALPAREMPLFLHCKDNIVFGEMQIPIFRSGDGSGGSRAKNYDKAGWGNEPEMRTVLLRS